MPVVAKRKRLPAYRYRTKVCFSLRGLLREVMSLEWPQPGREASVRPTWVAQTWTIKYIGRVDGGWLVRFVEKQHDDR